MSEEEIARESQIALFDLMYIKRKDLHEKFKIRIDHPKQYQKKTTTLSCYNLLTGISMI